VRGGGVGLFIDAGTGDDRARGVVLVRWVELLLLICVVEGTRVAGWLSCGRVDADAENEGNVNDEEPSENSVITSSRLAFA
jgi:hypothetical protein